MYIGIGTAITDRPSRATWHTDRGPRRFCLSRQEMNTREKAFQISTKIRIRQRNYHPLDLAHPLHTLAGIAGTYRQPMRNPLFSQFPDPGGRILPLFPENSTQSPHDPTMKRSESAGTPRETVIIPPAPEVLVQMVDNLVNRLSTTTVSQFTHPVFISFYRFRMDAGTRLIQLTGETKTEKTHPPSATHG